MSTWSMMCSCSWLPLLIVVFVVHLQQLDHLVLASSVHCPSGVRSPCSCSRSGMKFRPEDAVTVKCTNASSLEEVINALRPFWKTKTPISLQITDTPVAFLPAEAFGNLTVIRLEMSRNNLQDMDLVAFDYVLVESLVELTLIENQLSVLPWTAVPRLRNLKRLGLRNNKIKQVHGSILQLYNNLVHLVSLDLSGNQISSVPTETTAIMPKLEYINLTANRLTEVPYGFLNRHRSTLKSLDLAHNQINHLLALGLDLPLLDSMDLSHNRITNLSVYAFGGLSGLRRLNLETNRLSQWNPVWFCAVAGLRHLKIGKNAIRKIPAGAMRCLQDLETMDVSSGGIEKIASNGFRSADKLKTIVFRGNRLSRIDRTTFSGMPKLSTIDFSENIINKIEDSAFSSLSSVVAIDLSNNRLTTLQPGVFKNAVDKAYALQLCDNPWLCDHDLEPFRQWLRDNMEIMIDKPDCQPLCDQPQALQNWPLRFPDPPPKPHLYIPELSKLPKPTVGAEEWDFNPVTAADFPASAPENYGKNNGNSSVQRLDNKPPYVLRILLKKVLNESARFPKRGPRN